MTRVHRGRPAILSAMLVCIVTVAVLAQACNPKRPVTTHPPPSAWPGTVDHVIIVTIDGLRSDEVGEELTPTLQKMIDEGASTLAAQTVKPSLTLPAHTSMVTGLTPDQHHIKWNSYRPEYGDLSAESIFDIARKNGLKTAVFAGKDKLKHIVQKDDVDACTIESRNDRDVLREAIQYLHLEQPNLMLVHLPGVDRAGHFAGWTSDKQRAVIREVDSMVGWLLDAIETLELQASTVVIVTSDHGGQGRHHVAKDHDNQTVPWIVWGGPIEPARIAPVSITATANTTLRLLGIELPDDWADREAASAPLAPATSP
jgi:predicted AlkP superfamily pyrophosphatase or phosphodiesterase